MRLSNTSQQLVGLSVTLILMSAALLMIMTLAAWG